MDNQENRPEQFQESNPGSNPGQPVHTGFSTYDNYEQPVKMKHSGPGIASFIVSLVMFVVFIISIIGAAAAVGDIVNDPTLNTGNIEEEIEGNASIFAAVGLSMIAVVLGHIIGLILGIIGLVQKQRKKVFAILGTVFNGLAVLLVLLLILFGAAMNSAV